ncbi:MAG: GFA family protein [Gammaproteobacteria bacterium]|nr:GFA family protein [Gammaproteobacteria bacterium]
MSQTDITGSCLCGKVSYQLSGNSGVFQYCHCSRCRKFSGSAHAANLIVSPEQFKWLSGEDHVGRFEHPDAKHFATSFCKNCGSSLPWLGKSRKAVVVPAGTLDVDPGIRPSQNIFWGSRAEWYQEAADLVKHDELPAR